MTRTTRCIPLALLLICQTFTSPLVGQEANVVQRSTTAPNAAGIYWIAFAAMPTLTDAEKSKIDDAIKSTTQPVSEEAVALLARYETSLRELHRARPVTSCDWQLDETQGPYLLLSHLQKARELSRAAVFRARLRFSMNDIDPAVSDVLDVLKLARDCGNSPILISFLVDVAIEKSAIELLAANLGRMNPQQLDRVLADWKQLPPTATLTDCVRWEARTFGGWIESRIDQAAKKLKDPNSGHELLSLLEKDLGTDLFNPPNPGQPEAVKWQEMLKNTTVNDLRKSLTQLRADYESMANISGMSYAERKKRFEEFETNLAKYRTGPTVESLQYYFSMTLLPAVAKVSERDEQIRLQRHLIELAIQVQRHGTQVLNKNSPVVVESIPSEKGFKLSTPFGEKTEVLEVGTSK